MATRAAIDRTAKLAPDAPVTALPGVGPTSAARLATVGIRTVLDLVSFFPRRCQALRELPAPEEGAVGELVRLTGTVQGVRSAWLPGRRSMTTVTFACDDGSGFEAPFFNQPWLKKNYPVGQRRRVEGVLVQKGRRFVVQQARVLPLAAAPTGEVQLRYPDIEGIGGARLQQWLAAALASIEWDHITLPPLPAGLEEFTQRPAGLLLAMHRPQHVAEHEAARRHFAVREAVAVFRAGGGNGTIKVVGHASSRTPNMTVERHLEVIFQKSQARANAVAQALIRAGVPASKVIVEAVGDSQPIFYESMPKGEAGNRRAEIFVQG